MMKTLTTLLLALLISGCSLRPEAKPPITQYYLDPSIALACTPSTIDKALRLNFVKGPEAVSREGIAYTRPGLQSGDYLYSRWKQPPSEAISTALYTVLKDKEIFSRLIYDNSLISSELTLDIKVLQFEHRFEDEKNASAMITFNAMIYDTQTRALLASRLFRSNVPSKTPDAKGGVKALNKALGQLLSELICWSADESSHPGTSRN